MDSSPVDVAVLRLLMQGSSDEEGNRQPMFRGPTHGSSMDLGAPMLSQEEQMRLLQLQLQEQQQILMELQQRTTNMHGQEGQPSSSAAPAGEQHGSEARRAARRAATAKQRNEVADLEDRLQGISAVHSTLAAENSMLRRRMQLLEGGVQMREQHVAALLKGHQQRQQHSESLEGHQGGPEQGQDYVLPTGEPPGPSNSRSSRDASSSRQLMPEGLPSHSEPHRWTSFSQFPDPKAWSPATCSTVRALTPNDYQRLWTEFVKEASMLALSTEAHGVDSHVQVRLLDVVTSCLDVTDAIIAINPSAYYSSLYVNMITGRLETPTKDYWRRCLGRIQLSPEQLDFCKTAMEEHTRRLVPVMSERSRLASDLGDRLVLLGPTEASDLQQRLQSNVHKERVTNSFIIDFLTMKVLTPVQIALLSAASYPLLPDPTAIAEVALESL